MSNTMKDRTALVAVYLLYDPLYPDGKTYVGTSYRPKGRLYDHISWASRQDTPKSRWIRNMLEEGRKPAMKILGWFDEEDSLKMEKEIFMQKRFSGMLLNETMPSRGGLVQQAPKGKSYQGIVKKVGRTSGHVIVPGAWIGKTVKVTLLD